MGESDLKYCARQRSNERLREMLMQKKPKQIYEIKCNLCNHQFQTPVKLARFCNKCKLSDRYLNASLYEGRY
jgi:Zn finger protein HypA/HybF involved in hydrogenase expression